MANVKCTVCGFKVEYDHVLKQTVCSEFCMETSEGDKAAFKALKPGDFGPWPCRKCGCLMEDTYPKAKTQQVCSDCYHKERFATRTKLLQKAGERLPLGSPLRASIEAELRKKA